MIEAVWIGWGMAALACFARWPGPSAAVAILLSGWVLLPTMNFQAYAAGSASDDWFQVRGLALPQPVFWTRGVVIGLVVLLAVLLFDRRRLAACRPCLGDVPFAIWCLLPALAGVSAGLAVSEWLANTVYHALVWAAPYLVGRVYLADRAGRLALVRGLAVAGLAYIPLCLWEMVQGPFLYSVVYGFHPHQMEGAGRWLGFRPVVWMEHGNALGIWMAALALTGFIGWRAGAFGVWARALRPAGGLGLPATALLTQAVGPIVLLLGGLGAFAGRRWLRWWLIVVVLIAPLLGYVSFRLVDPVHVRPAIETVLGPDGLDRVRELPKAGSMGWRVRREEEQMQQVRERPLLGHGAWDWWQGEHAAPWSLWMLTLGQYGLVGVVTLLGMFLLPLGLFLRASPPRAWGRDPDRLLGGALAILLAMCLVDNMINSTFNVVLIAAAGALVGHAYAVSAASGKKAGHAPES